MPPKYLFPKLCSKIVICCNTYCLFWEISFKIALICKTLTRYLVPAKIMQQNSLRKFESYKILQYFWNCSTREDNEKLKFNLKKLYYFGSSHYIPHNAVFMTMIAIYTPSQLRGLLRTIFFSGYAPPPVTTTRTTYTVIAPTRPIYLGKHKNEL